MFLAVSRWISAVSFGFQPFVLLSVMQVSAKGFDGDKLKQNSETCVNPNSAQVQALASKLQETQLEHEQLYSAQERQLQLEAQALRQSQQRSVKYQAKPENMNWQYKSSAGKLKNSQVTVENAAIPASILQS